MRLLIVEDVAAVGRATARLLRRYGYTVATATSCLEANGIVGYFDCAIVDLELPDGSGVDLARKLLRTGRIGRVIFFSATMNAARQLEAEAFGIFVHKLDGVGALMRQVSEVQRSMAQLAERRSVAVAGGHSVSAGPEAPGAPQGKISARHRSHVRTRRR